MPRLARAIDANPVATSRPPSPDESGEVETTSVRAARAVATHEHFAVLPVGSVPTNGASADVDIPAHAEGSVPELDFELTFEHDFFSSSPPVSEPPIEVEEDPEQRALTIAEYERRLWFRRHVARLMAFLAAFALLALLLRLSTAG